MPAYVEKYTAKYGMPLNFNGLRLRQNLLMYSKLADNPRGGAVFGAVEQPVDLKGLLQRLKIPSRKELHSQLNQIFPVLPDTNSKFRMLLLKAYKYMLKDESRAYKAGGKISALYNGGQPGRTNSEMFATLYDEMIKVVNKKMRAERIDNIRQKPGLKPLRDNTPAMDMFNYGIAPGYTQDSVNAKLFKDMFKNAKVVTGMFS